MSWWHIRHLTKQFLLVSMGVNCLLLIFLGHWKAHLIITLELVSENRGPDQYVFKKQEKKEEKLMFIELSHPDFVQGFFFFLHKLYYLHNNTSQIDIFD